MNIEKLKEFMTSSWGIALLVGLVLVFLFLRFMRRARKNPRLPQNKKDDCGKVRRIRKVRATESLLYLGTISSIVTILWMIQGYVFVGILIPIFLFMIYKSFFPVIAGKWFVFQNLGKGFAGGIASNIPGYMLNDPRSANFDSRYRSWSIIPTVNHEGKVSWGKPGYKHNEVDRTYRDDRVWIERFFGFVFRPYPFYSVATQGYTEHKIVGPEEADDYKARGWRVSWTSHDKKSVRIERDVVTKYRDIVFNDELVITDLETGKGASESEAEGEGKAETAIVDIMIKVQVYVSNIFTMFVRSKNPSHEIASVATEQMVTFVGNNHYDDLVQIDHALEETTDPLKLTFKKAIKRANGERHEDDLSCLLGGTDEYFGFIFGNAWWLGITPSDEMTENMLNARKKIFIATQKKAEYTLLGQAEGSLYEERRNAEARADSGYLNAVNSTPANPNVVVIAEKLSDGMTNFGKNGEVSNGNRVFNFGDMLSTITTINADAPQRTPRKTIQSQKKPVDGKRKDDGTNVDRKDT